MDFWLNVLPITGVIFLVLSCVIGGIALFVHGDSRYPITWQQILGVALVMLGVSFLFACFGYANANSL